MKNLIKKTIPAPILRLCHRIKQEYEDRRNAKLAPKAVFSTIYKDKKWDLSNSEGLCSGAGSVDESIVLPYVTKIKNFLDNLPSKPRVIDLGCGDFNIGRNFVDSCSEYVAADVVDDLIEQHKASCYCENVDFQCLDIIDEDLPDADICFLRQVLQHLSNAQIIKILQKIKKYPIIFITEHYPSENDKIVPNKDKVHGTAIRVFSNSGVYLSEPPFNILPHDVEVFLEVPSNSLPNLSDPGVIRTFKFELPYHHKHLHPQP
jgi:hypothetical protein